MRFPSLGMVIFDLIHDSLTFGILTNGPHIEIFHAFGELTNGPDTLTLSTHFLGLAFVCMHSVSQTWYLLRRFYGLFFQLPTENLYSLPDHRLQHDNSNKKYFSQLDLRQNAASNSFTVNFGRLFGQFQTAFINTI